nr:MAG TPA_asm: hypothetical protein [Bacteriophage sp.]
MYTNPVYTDLSIFSIFNKILLLTNFIFILDLLLQSDSFNTFIFLLSKTTLFSNFLLSSLAMLIL